jgi:hypothetical protein
MASPVAFLAFASIARVPHCKNLLLLSVGMGAADETKQNISEMVRMDYFFSLAWFMAGVHHVE